jgi:hypothetical protein
LIQTANSDYLIPFNQNQGKLRGTNKEKIIKVFNFSLFLLLNFFEKEISGSFELFEKNFQKLKTISH